MIQPLLQKRERELYRFQAAIDPSAALGFSRSDHVRQIEPQRAL